MTLNDISCYNSAKGRILGEQWDVRCTKDAYCVVAQRVTNARNGLWLNHRIVTVCVLLLLLLLLEGSLSG